LRLALSNVSTGQGGEVLRQGIVRGVIVILAVAPAAAAQSGPLARANWLAGCWELRASNRVTLEMWMPALGDMMLGASRTTVGAATSEYEQLRLSVDGNRLVYTSVPSRQKEASFPSIEVSDTTLVFENTAHDFPQRIIYRRRGADSIIARIEGPGTNGTRGVNFPMRRSNCLTVAPPTPPDTVLLAVDLAPDQKQMLVVRGVAPNIDVFLYDASGTPVRKLTDHANFDYQSRWSPDGQRLAYTSVRENRQVIFTMRPDGSETTQLTANGVQNSEPAWSPDGRRIVFRSERNGNPDIFVMNADGSDQRPLTTDARPEYLPAWSPDGSRILFSTTVDSRAHVFIMNADGTGQRQLTQSATGHSRLASWSPDGKQIVFNTTRDGNDEIYVMAADGSNPRNVSNHPANDVPFGWSADGQSILFLSTRDRTARDVYRMKADGTGVTRITMTK
jgi:Tol biopolymer transport system component